jgi:NADP-dependent 3-hydroxy acid dehydrogenase YdfG
VGSSESVQALFDLSGRVAVADAGAAVVLVARREDALESAASEIRARDGEAVPVVADLNDRDALPDIADRCRRAIGRVGIVVNAAGVNLREPVEHHRSQSHRAVLFHPRVHPRHA